MSLSNTAYGVCDRRSIGESNSTVVSTHLLWHAGDRVFASQTETDRRDGCVIIELVLNCVLSPKYCLRRSTSIEIEA